MNTKSSLKKAIVMTALMLLIAVMVIFTSVIKTGIESKPPTSSTSQATVATETTALPTTAATTEAATETEAPAPPESEKTIEWNNEWEYASFSAIHTDTATLYYTTADNRKNKVVCINAGHGTKGGSSVRTQCHPDGTPKVTGGSTAAGSVTATAINEGTSLFDGTSEADANLSLALLVKETLLQNGYDVLMLRENTNTQLDNIARTVIANNNADCHIALHYDSTENDKGLFYLGVPDVSAYRSMEPVKSHWQQHEALGKALLNGERSAGVKIFSSGRMEIDLTQTSYSTIPSVDLEVGDRASSASQAVQQKIAEGIAVGLDEYFSER